ncbi:CobW family GTP-binding protein [Chachezhania antarctica]|uniref:CobW family GTP-binding protein n=1 Tax=Chachezhania antarctica TaxID=2340860 RepID=UPI000EB04E81|nr:CobW family GTP-binding protein [Chachezhania antarctica]
MTGPALPVTVIGGYLGAGKTTLVNHLLRSSGLRLAVMVNEFGALPIDRDLIEAEDEALISISGGCVCCEYGDDMVSALMKITEMAPGLDHILLESSGVAIPGSIMASLLFLDGLRGDGVVVMADAAGIRETAANSYLTDTIQRQLDDADIVVLNKADLVAPEDLAATRTWLRDHVPGTRIVEAEHGKVSPQVLLGAIPLPRQGHKVTGHADALFQSRVLHPAEPVDAIVLARGLAEGDLGLVRAKGYVPKPGGGMSLIQVVGSRWTVEDAGDSHAPGIVCIGLKATFDPAQLERLGQLDPV